MACKNLKIKTGIAFKLLNIVVGSKAGIWVRVLQSRRAKELTLSTDFTVTPSNFNRDIMKTSCPYSKSIAYIHVAEVPVLKEVINKQTCLSTSRKALQTRN